MPLIDIEASLICLVSNTVSHLSTKHHLTASHVVVHDVLKIWHKCIWVDEVEVNELFSCQLYSNISWHEVDECSLIDRMIVNPLHDFLVLIPLLLEE